MALQYIYDLLYVSGITPVIYGLFIINNDVYVVSMDNQKEVTLSKVTPTGVLTIAVVPKTAFNHNNLFVTIFWRKGFRWDYPVKELECSALSRWEETSDDGGILRHWSTIITELYN